MVLGAAVVTPGNDDAGTQRLPGFKDAFYWQLLIQPRRLPFSLYIFFIEQFVVLLKDVLFVEVVKV